MDMDCDMVITKDMDIHTQKTIMVNIHMVNTVILIKIRDITFN